MTFIKRNCKSVQSRYFFDYSDNLLFYICQLQMKNAIEVHFYSISYGMHAESVGRIITNIPFNWISLRFPLKFINWAKRIHNFSWLLWFLMNFDGEWQKWAVCIWLLDTYPYLFFLFTIKVGFFWKTYFIHHKKLKKISWIVE